MDDALKNEALARSLCEERWGEGSYDEPGRQRSYWRRQAKRQERTESKPLAPNHHNLLLED